jgi:hypothetical protein
VIASTTIVLATALALAAGTLVEEGFGFDSSAYFVTAVGAGAFCFILVGGYVSTLAFGCLFVASLSLIATGLKAADSASPFVAGVVLFALASSAHPIFGLFGFLLIAIAGLSLVKAPKYEGQGLLGPANLVGVSLVGAAVLTLVVLQATGWVVRTQIGTSADAILRRLEPHLLLHAFRARLLGAFVSARFFLGSAAVSLCVLAWINHRKLTQRYERRLVSRFVLAFIVAWAAVTSAGIVALELGVTVPAQRLVNFALPLPLLCGAAVLAMRRTGSAKWRHAVAFLAIVVALSSGYFAWQAWDRHKPPTSAAANIQAAETGRVFTSSPSGSRLIVVTDSKDKPAQWAATVSNLLREYVPPRRVAQVHVDLGQPGDLAANRPTLTGQRIHDEVSTDLWRGLRTIQPTDLVVVLSALDPSSYASLAHQSGTHAIATGVISPAPGFPLRTQSRSAALWSSWLPVWLTVALLLGSLCAGWPWAHLVLPRASARTLMSLAPAFGFASLAACAIVVDTAGFRMSGLGKWITVVAMIVGPLAARELRRRVRPIAPEPV